MGEKDSKLAISVPGEWALEKVLGPVFGEIGTDLQKLYSLGRDKIAQAALKKIKDPEDGAQANLRVARDVFWNGSFTNESICAEYFGGILAASRSVDGKDDAGIFYVDIIKSLSSGQLRMHYILYRALNKELMSDPAKKSLNPGKGSELSAIELFIPLIGTIEQIEPEDLAAVLHGLNSKKLIDDFHTDNQKLEDGRSFPYLRINPTTLGIQLFSIANNRFSSWKKFSIVDFGDFEDVNVPALQDQALDGLLKKAGLEKISS